LSNVELAFPTPAPKQEAAFALFAVQYCRSFKQQSKYQGAIVIDQLDQAGLYGKPTKLDHLRRKLKQRK